MPSTLDNFSGDRGLIRANVRGLAYEQNRVGND
jgi:hypothetical protein